MPGDTTMRTTTMNSMIKGLGAALLAFALASCGSGLSSTTSGGGTGGSSNGNVSLGSGTGSAFKSGVLDIAVSNLSAGGSTSITATIVDSSGTLYSQSVSVIFNSPCISLGKASISGSGASGTTFTTTTGTIIATYTATGCSGSDAVTATASVGTATLTASGTVKIAAASLGSIQFESANPSTITLKGMGGAGLQQTSTVKFVVKDSVGGVVSGADVSFKLVSSTGGVTLSAATATSDANGEVQTIVQSGTRSGPVVVKATITVNGVDISTTSTGLAIQSGIPSQSHFSLSIDKFNIEGYNIDNNTATLTASLADRFGNPVPDGTTVSFSQSGFEFGAGGRVQGSCDTSNGTCSVVWSSQDPRPTDIAGNQHVGFAYVLANASGEESFTDQNGDGVFDTVSGTAEPFSDIGEPFAPSAEFAKSGATSSYVLGENYNDFDNSSDYTAADGKWEGVNCQAGNTCGKDSSGHLITSAGVGKFMCIVMSSSGAAFSNATVGGVSTPISGGTVTATGATSMTVDISDANGNVLANGTTITLDTGSLVGATATLTPATSGTYTVGNVSCQDSVFNWPATFTITLTVTAPVSGNIGVLVTSPSGTTSEIVFTL